MSVCIQTAAENRSSFSRISVREAELRAEFNAIPSWRERAQTIYERLQATKKALSTRNEKLLALSGGFYSFPLDFSRTFAPRRGCQNPPPIIAPQQRRTQA